VVEPKAFTNNKNEYNNKKKKKSGTKKLARPRQSETMLTGERCGLGMFIQLLFINVITLVSREHRKCGRF
jgi:hypothetical protein